jgi:hypothetical protein
MSMLSVVLLYMSSLVFALHPSTDGGWEANGNEKRSPPNPFWRRGIPAEGYYNPQANGGSMLTVCAFYQSRVSLSANYVISKRVVQILQQGSL